MFEFEEVIARLKTVNAVAEEGIKETEPGTNTRGMFVHISSQAKVLQDIVEQLARQGGD